MPLLMLIFLLILTSCGGKITRPQATPLRDLPAPLPLAVNWQVSTEASTVPGARLEPLVISASEVIFASGRKLVAVTDGKIRWQQSLSAEVSGGVSGDGFDRLALVSGNQVEVREQATGNLRWQQTLSSLALAKPLFIFDLLLVRSSDGTLLALDAQSGQVRWRYQSPIPSLQLLGHSSPVSLENQVIAQGFDDGKLALFNRDGTPLWERYPISSSGRSIIARLNDLDAAPLLLRDTLFVASYQQALVALAVNDGQVYWRYPVSTFQNLDSDGLSIFVSAEDDSVHAVSAVSGQLRWKNEDLRYRGLSAPLLFGRFLAVGDAAGVLHLLDTASGQIVGRRALTTSPITALAADRRTLYAQQANGELFALTLNEAASR
jgi:outer membrane protein assembly factor BamB